MKDYHEEQMREHMRESLETVKYYINVICIIVKC